MPVIRESRRGWTLVELLVVIAVGGALAGVVMRALAFEQRSSRASTEIRAARAELRDAAQLLVQELRGASTADTIRFAADTAIELFVPVLTAVACAPSATNRLLLADPLGRQELSAVTPDTGDIAWVWRGDTILPPGRWVRAQIASFGTTGADECDARFAATERPAALVLRTAAGVLDAGTPVQVVRRVRYNIYRASDGAWYLGYRRCDAIGASRCQTVQPVAGPFRARSGGVGGIELRYFDASGTPTSAPMAMARIDVVIRTNVTDAARRAPRRLALDDSATISVGLRNAF